MIGIEEMRIGQPGAIEFHAWKTLIPQNVADVAMAAAEAEKIGHDQLACIIYTSATGGSPRGVIQHQRAILCNVEGCCVVIAEDFGWEDEIFLSFLPLSHAYEHTGVSIFRSGWARRSIIPRGSTSSHRIWRKSGRR